VSAAASWFLCVAAIAAVFWAYQVIDLPHAVHRTTHATTTKEND